MGKDPEVQYSVKHHLIMTLQMTSGMAGMSVNDKKGHGTIKAPASIDPEADAGVLRKAMKGLGMFLGTLRRKGLMEYPAMVLPTVFLLIMGDRSLVLLSPTTPYTHHVVCHLQALMKQPSLTS